MRMKVKLMVRSRFISESRTWSYSWLRSNLRLGLTSVKLKFRIKVTVKARGRVEVIAKVRVEVTVMVKVSQG